MAEIKLHPLNKLAFMVTLTDVDPVTGEEEPLTSGAASAFLATSDLPTATAADPSLTAALVVHTATPPGDWLVVFDAADLDPALLASLFGGVDDEAFAIVVVDNNVRAVVPLTYEATRTARVR